MVDWDAARAFTQQACAEVFDTKRYFAIGLTKPPRDVNASSLPDPERPIFEFLGSAIDTNPTLNQIGAGERASASSSADRNTFRSCITAYTENWPWMLRQGDHVQQVETGRIYALAASPDRDGSDRRLFWLNKV